MGIADELITRGWGQGHYEDPVTGKVCLYGAAIRAAGYHPSELVWNDIARREMWAVADAVGLGETVIGFNDTPGRTFDEVLRVAKQADELLDAQRLTGEMT